MAGPYVIKIGGSLEEQIDQIIAVLRHRSCPCLIVPGGGRFADMIRRTGLEGEHAHWMAIAAMEQFGWLIASRGVAHGSTLHRPEDVEVFLPYVPLRKANPFPYTWDVTSDTIAAWVAHFLGLDLILLKSVDGIYEGGDLIERVPGIIKTRVVDPSFIPFVLRNGVKTPIMNGKVPERLDLFLNGYPVTGTTIGF
jgi:5-(aminomethyl)-3-furanmethanol phosphate kinase